jgi:TonB family protein
MAIIRPCKNSSAILCSIAFLFLCLVPSQAQDNARKLLKKAPVPYPLILKSKGIGGTVRLKVFVKPDGTVRDTEVLGGNPILAESAQKSVMQWKFSPSSSETAIEISVVFDAHSDSGS